VGKKNGGKDRRRCGAAFLRNAGFAAGSLRAVSALLPTPASSVPAVTIPAQESEMIGNSLALTMIPAVLVGLLYYVVLFFCVWKFYQMLSRINNNLAGIRQALVRGALKPPEP
jgi:hypothetical protein